MDDEIKTQIRERLLRIPNSAGANLSRGWNRAIRRSGDLSRMVKKLKPSVASVKMDDQNEEPEAGATAGVRDGIGEPGTSAAE